jgi:hypothetical protein
MSVDRYVTRDRALAARPPHEEVDVPEWGGRVVVRGLTLGERRELLARYPELLERGGADPVRLNDFLLDLLLMTVLGGDGQRLFSDDDREALMSQPPQVIDRLVQKALELSGLTVTGIQAAQANLAAT